MLLIVALCLSGHLEPSHFAGALSDADDISSRPVEQMSRAELSAELLTLDKYKTVFVGPVVISGIGAVLAVVGIAFEALGAFYAYLGGVGGAASAGLSVLTTFGYVLLGLGGVALVAGGVLLVIGLVKLFPALALRRVAAERRDDVQHRLDELDQQSAPSPPPFPPPPPGARLWQGPQPGLLLAAF